jgi:hypothetical protein
MIWNEDIKQVVLFEETPQGTGIWPVPASVNEINETAELGLLPLSNGEEQVCWKWHDWILVPRNSNVGILHQFMDPKPLAATSLKDLVGQTHFLTEEGILKKSGSSHLVFSGISIDDFLK